jgi:hypothetical protein
VARAFVACARARRAVHVSSAGGEFARCQRGAEDGEHALHGRDRLIASGADGELDVLAIPADHPVGKAAALLLERRERAQVVLDAGCGPEDKPQALRGRLDIDPCPRRERPPVLESLAHLVLLQRTGDRGGVVFVHRLPPVDFRDGYDGAS